MRERESKEFVPFYPNQEWYAVDLDGTLADTSPPLFLLSEAKANKELIQALQKLKEQGNEIAIFTSRHWGDLPAIEEWLEKNKVPHRMVVCGKLLATWYVDTKNLRPDEVIKRVVGE